MILIYTTCRDTAEAVKIGQLIIEQKMAIAVNLWPIQSLRAGDGGTAVSEREAILIVKTNEQKVQDVENLILKNHTYAIPFIGVINLYRVNREYKEWMQKVMQMS
ncbi:MAG: divalent cation tolerance protein CutA [Patescibacteria group bacterium]